MSSSGRSYYALKIRARDVGTTVGMKLNVPVIYFTQLLGLALGIDEKKLGL